MFNIFKCRKKTTEPDINIKALMQDIEESEGRVSYAYQDHLGYWTIGIGFLIDERRGGGLMDSEIDFIFRNRVQVLISRIDERLPWLKEHPENVQRALIEMAYQMGLTGLLEFKKTLAQVKAGHYSKAAKEALDSRWARQTPNRAEKVTKLIAQGDSSGTIE